MRAHGILVRWNDERGFGFIAPAGSAAELFVHISAFPRDGRRPAVGETVSFEVEVTPEGKRRAVQVWRPDAARSGESQVPRSPRRNSRGRRWVATVPVILLIAAVLGFFAYKQHRRATSVVPAVPAAPGTIAQPLLSPLSSPYRCDGRRYCSQMTSCAEARFFLANCPDTELDGNRDGEPCEQQWCD